MENNVTENTQPGTTPLEQQGLETTSTERRFHEVPLEQPTLPSEELEQQQEHETFVDDCMNEGVQEETPVQEPSEETNQTAKTIMVKLTDLPKEKRREMLEQAITALIRTMAVTLADVEDMMEIALTKFKAHAQVSNGKTYTFTINVTKPLNKENKMSESKPVAKKATKKPAAKKAVKKAAKKVVAKKAVKKPAAKKATKKVAAKKAPKAKK